MENNKIFESPLKVLGLITARKGSKRLPGKNIKKVNGVPLIMFSIIEAYKAKCISEIAVSSDDQEVLAIADKANCRWVINRPKFLANDDTPSFDVVMHALQVVDDYDFIILLQPTSPLRKAEHIDQAFSIFMREKADTCLSVSKSSKDKKNLYLMDNRKRLFSASDEPDAKALSQVYLNGAIYIAASDTISKQKGFFYGDSVAYEMSEKESLDIDTFEDFQVFQSYIEELAPPANCKS